ncbi:multidrug ABC transporter ATPase [Microbacterium sp. gxy059]|uniref:multidrug ABC transporter ATPase n=1 Tax=Microbacterium sp. gxy059 TaxID=2957199 RepID=UPI003D95E255
MSTNSDDAPVVRWIDRALAFSSLGILALSIVCFASVMIAGAVGVDDYSTGLWPTVFVVQMVGPVVAFALLLALLITSFVRRSRSAKG